MKLNSKLRHPFLILIIVVCIGISMPFLLREYDAMRLGLFAHRIAGTNRIVASCPISTVTLTLTGDDANRIVQAVSSAKAYRPGFGKELACSFLDKATFFKGTNVLDNINMCGSTFLIHGTYPAYKDESSLLKSLLDYPFAQAINDAVMKDYESHHK